jgi:hypothetical protein
MIRAIGVGVAIGIGGEAITSRSPMPNSTPAPNV